MYRSACPSQCSACSIPNFTVISTYSQVQCTACLPGSVLSGGSCVSQCPIGQFVGSDGLTCQPCNSSCSTCAGSSTFCLTCAQSGLYALNGTCTSSCPASTFTQASSVSSSANFSTSVSTSSTGGTCSSCHPDCQTCSGSRFDQCTSCPPSRPVKTASGRCLQTCSKGQFWDEVSGECQGCANGCASCADAAANMCLSCVEGMILQAGQCVASSCPGGAAGVSTLGGVCLATLLGVSGSTSAAAPAAPDATGTKTTSGLSWWKYLLILGFLVAAIAIALMVWRWRARKRRALETKHFKERLERDGIRIGNRITVLWDRVFKKDQDDPAEERRRRLRDQLRKSKMPADTLGFLRDLEGDEGSGEKPAYGDRVEGWRSGVSSSQASRRHHFRSSTASDTTALVETSREEPAAPRSRLIRKAPPEWNSLAVPKRQSVSETISVYSQVTSADAAGGASSSSKLGGRGMPVPREPIKDSTFDAAQMQSLATPLRYPPPYSNNVLSLTASPGMLQYQPLIGAPGLTLPTAGTNGVPTAWQTPVLTGSSNGVSAASQLGDKNPFRNRF